MMKAASGPKFCTAAVFVVVTVPSEVTVTDCSGATKYHTRPASRPMTTMSPA